MIGTADVGGVHVKYLHHCTRQLWLYARGVRPEKLSAAVALGEAVHDTSYTRHSPVDLGAARLDFVDGENWVHEVKSSATPTAADEAQVLHYCYRLNEAGVPAKGGILHYPKSRRTQRIDYTTDSSARAQADIDAVVAAAARAKSPPRLPRPACKGCSYQDYCWGEDA